MCRADLAALEPRDDSPSTHDCLAAEVRYDRALLRLCASLGIGTSVERFSPPRDERHRLEHALAVRDIDLSLRGSTRDPTA